MGCSASKLGNTLATDMRDVDMRSRPGELARFPNTGLPRLGEIVRSTGAAAVRREPPDEADFRSYLSKALFSEGGCLIEVGKHWQKFS